MKENEMVTSVFGEISRRELLRYLGAAGLAFGLGGRGLFALPPDGAAVPPVKLGGTPFREITNFQTFIDEKYDIRKFQKAGTPKPRSRDTSWLDKPSNALGVSLLQFTNPASISLNSCSQAATATVLNFYKKAPTGLVGDAITEKIYGEYPPDGGERGTSFRHTVKTMESYGLKTWSGWSNELGEETMIEKLKTYVSQGRPCTLLVDLKAPRRITGAGMQGHFVVVYAYNETHVFMTNWNYGKKNGWLNDWATFKTAWSLPEGRMHHSMAVGWA
ncbi:MAG: C39 family peptidase [Pyrinomonadaceae bacterium]|nr:C39 family peptidase [Pyrinomonadaceae bacterium]